VGRQATRLGPGRAALVAEVSEWVGSRREASWIVEHVESEAPGRDRSVETVAVAARELADRRACGEPLQYVLGHWSFREIELTVDRRVLIPRPETEQLVEVALGELRRTVGRSPDRSDRICVDLGTGSGAIALSFATEAVDITGALEVWATDRSADALAVARANLSTLVSSNAAGVNGARAHVCVATGEWFDALPENLAGSVDLIASNPPYVARDEFDALDATVREWEPLEALVAGPGSDGTPGLADIESIVRAAPEWLHETGSLVVELAPHQADPAVAVARLSGFTDATIARDLAGLERMLVARRT
jgi:release factor glutamine methyltransferase